MSTSISSIIPIHVFIVRKYFEVDSILAYATNPINNQRERVRISFVCHRENLASNPPYGWVNTPYFQVINQAGFSWKAARKDLTSICVAVALKEQ